MERGIMQKGLIKKKRNAALVKGEAKICLACPTPEKKCNGSCEYFRKKYKKLKEAVKNEKHKRTVKRA